MIRIRKWGPNLEWFMVTIPDGDEEHVLAAGTPQETFEDMLEFSAEVQIAMRRVLRGEADA